MAARAFYGARLMQPVAFKIGTLSIHWYGVLVAIAFLFGLWTAARRGVRDRIAPNLISDAGPWLILGTIVGARFVYVVTYWKESFAGRPLLEVLMIQRGGLVFYGGLVGASLAVIIYCRIRHIPLWKFADAMAPSIALGYIFGRLGCFMNGCCYGRACSLPWAVKYPQGNDTHGIAVHPTQIYDSLLNLGLYLFLAWMYRRKKFDGQIFALYLVCYAFTRSFVEYFRGDYGAGHIHAGFLTPAQVISIVVLATGVVLFAVLRRTSAPAR
jgi:phosphatidylglycerol:prolipoprotein diacylglycerol transferase